MQLCSIAGPLNNQLLQLNRLDDTEKVIRRSQLEFFGPFLAELVKLMDPETGYDRAGLMKVTGENFQELDQFSLAQLLNVATISILQRGSRANSDVVHSAALADNMTKRMMNLELFEHQQGQDDNGFEKNKFNRIIYAFTRPYVFEYLQGSRSGGDRIPAREDYSTDEQKSRWGKIGGSGGGWASTNLNKLFGEIEGAGFSTVDRRIGSTFSREDFLNNYVEKGKPVAVDGLIDNWPAIQAWGTQVSCVLFYNYEREN